MSRSLSTAATGTPIVKHGLVNSLWWAAAGCTGVGIVLALLPATGHDQLWFLVAGERLLGGAKLYGPEVFDSNPPLIMWLSAAIVWLARLLHLEPTLIFKTVQLAALVTVAVFSLKILQRQFPERFLKPLVALFFALAYLAVPARDFGQREHLLSFLCLPYLLIAAMDDAPIAWRIGAAVLAGVGFCFKPQQVLVPIFVELLLLGVRGLRSLRRPEPYILLSIGGSYIALVFWLTPEYVTVALPLLHQTYWAVGDLTFSQLLGESLQLHVLLLLNLALLLRKGWRSASRLTWVLLAAGVGADIAYLQQGTGWYYQQLPAVIFLTAAMLVQLCVWASSSDFSVPRWVQGSIAVLAILATFLTLHFSGYPLTRERAFAVSEPDPSFFTGIKPETPVAILSTEVEETMMPVARYHLFWAQRMNNLWWLPAILRSETDNPHHLSSEEIQRLDELQHHSMAEDLARWKPELVLVERCYLPDVHCQMMEDRHDDLLKWFSTGAEFRTAFASYQFMRSQGRFDAYRRIH